jgi:hypothetical protein
MGLYRQQTEPFFRDNIGRLTMAEVGPEALADVAYGLFELALNKELRAGGNFLFQLVETQIDFKDQFFKIFSRFADEYPQLAEALQLKFGGIGPIYEMIARGEGVVPSGTTQMYWIIQEAPDISPNAIEDELAGKWLIFLPQDQVDAAWKKVRDATCANILGISAKVSTAKPNPDSRDQMKVIYVYTADWQDEPEVMRVREELRKLGFIDRIGYKRNIETFKGEYAQKGKRVTFYSA